MGYYVNELVLPARHLDEEQVLSASLVMIQDDQYARTAQE